MLFWSTLFKFAKIGDLEIDNTLSLNFKRELVEDRCPIKILWKQNLALLCKILRICLIISWIPKLKNYYGAAFFSIYFAFAFQEIFQIVYCLDHHFREEGGTIYPTGYLFVQKVLAYRYFYHKEL